MRLNLLNIAPMDSLVKGQYAHDVDKADRLERQTL